MQNDGRAGGCTFSSRVAVLANTLLRRESMCGLACARALCRRRMSARTETRVSLSRPRSLLCLSRVGLRTLRTCSISQSPCCVATAVVLAIARQPPDGWRSPRASYDATDPSGPTQAIPPMAINTTAGLPGSLLLVGGKSCRCRGGPYSGVPFGRRLKTMIRRYRTACFPFIAGR